MPASPLDIKLSKYWSLLSPAQKKSLLEVVRSFVQSLKGISIEQYNRELKETEAEYLAGDHVTSEEMLKLIRQWGKITTELKKSRSNKSRILKSAKK